MISISQAVAKMIAYCNGNQYDINHFLKVWAYAKTIGELEGLDQRTQTTLELAAITHDIACPELRKEFGNSPGDLQEQYGPTIAREFYQDCGLDEEMLKRICYLIAHHHTLTGVDGLDYQILLEADFLVNAGENDRYRKSIKKYWRDVFKTQSGTALLESIYIN